MSDPMTADAGALDGHGRRAPGPGSHDATCFRWHPECALVARDAVDCRVPWHAMAYASAEQAVDHLVVCPWPVHRYDVAWHLRLTATQAQEAAQRLRASRSRAERVAAAALWGLDRLLHDAAGRKTVPRQAVDAVYRAACDVTEATP